MNQSIRETIYNLKMLYGVPLVIHQIVSNDVDFTNGRKTVITQNYRIRRAILIPKDLIRRIINLAGGSSFSSFEDQSLRTYIIDSREFPREYTLKIGDYIVENTQRFNIKSVEDFGNRQAVIVKAEYTVAERPQQIIDKTLQSNFEIQSGGDQV